MKKQKTKNSKQAWGCVEMVIALSCTGVEMYARGVQHLESFGIWHPCIILYWATTWNQCAGRIGLLEKGLTRK